MRITAVICTRNRTEHVVRAVASVLANDHPNFELIVVDQSNSEATRRLLEEYLAKYPNLHYVHTTRVGVSPARNTGITHGVGDVVAFTDDDCKVPPDWLRRIESVFEREPDVDLIYGQVEAAAELREAGEIVPALTFDTPRRVSRRDGLTIAGMTANCAVRRRLFATAAAFDEVLGPGRQLQSGEDFDFHYRVYRAGFVILLTPEVTVDHYGTRSFEEWPRRMAEYGFGDAAFYMKHVRCGDTQILWLLVRHLGWEMARALFRRPNARPYVRGFLRGLRESLRFGVDRRRRLYVQPEG